LGSRLGSVGLMSDRQTETEIDRRTRETERQKRSKEEQRTDRKRPDPTRHDKARFITMVPTTHDNQASRTRANKKHN
jgi:hypothetical protein